LPSHGAVNASETKALGARTKGKKPGQAHGSRWVGAAPLTGKKGGIPEVRVQRALKLGTGKLQRVLTAVAVLPFARRAGHPPEGTTTVTANLCKKVHAKGWQSRRLETAT